MKPMVSLKEQAMRLRMKLQTFLQQPGEYTPADYEKASNFLLDAEKLEMDLQMFKVLLNSRHS